MDLILSFREAALETVENLLYRIIEYQMEKPCDVHAECKERCSFFPLPWELVDWRLPLRRTLAQMFEGRSGLFIWLGCENDSPLARRFLKNLGANLQYTSQVFGRWRQDEYIILQITNDEVRYSYCGQKPWKILATRKLAIPWDSFLVGLENQDLRSYQEVALTLLSQDMADSRLADLITTDESFSTSLVQSVMRDLDPVFSLPVTTYNPFTPYGRDQGLVRLRNNAGFYGSRDQGEAEAAAPDQQDEADEEDGDQEDREEEAAPADSGDQAETQTELAPAEESDDEVQFLQITNVITLNPEPRGEKEKKGTPTETRLVHGTDEGSGYYELHTPVEERTVNTADTKFSAGDAFTQLYASGQAPGTFRQRNIGGHRGLPYNTTEQ